MNRSRFSRWERILAAYSAIATFVLLIVELIVRGHP